ncbi:MAG: hypothetical protein ACYDC3_11085 [Candidatus Binataceae bacterium]
MDDIAAEVSPAAAARMLRVCRVAMLVQWTLLVVLIAFSVLQATHPGGSLAILAPLGVLFAASFLLLSSRCPRCHRVFFGDKFGYRAMVGRFSCVGCGFNPNAEKTRGGL